MELRKRKKLKNMILILKLSFRNVKTVAKKKVWISALLIEKRKKKYMNTK